MSGRNPIGSLFRALVLVCIGCVLIAVGLSLGGSLAGARWWPWGRGSRPGAEWPDGKRSWSWHWERESRDGATIRDLEELSGTVADSVTEVEIDAGAARVIVRAGDSFEYRATDFAKGSFHAHVEGSSLRLDQDDWLESLPFGRRAKRPVLELVVPAGKRLSGVKIELGAGSLSVDGVSADRVILKTGAGEIESAGLSAKEVTVESGAGAIDFSDVRADELEVATGAGSVTLGLAGAEADWLVEFERGLGAVTVGSQSFNGVGSGSVGARDAARRVLIRTGVGAATVRFGD